MTFRAFGASRWLVLALVVACTVDGERAASEASAIVGGTPSGDAAVVALVTKLGDATGAICSGTVIAKRTVLTAGHCTRGIPPSSQSVHFGATSAAPDAVVAVVESHTYPAFLDLRADPHTGEDLAVVVLAEDAPVAPIPFSRDARSIAVGARARVVGFGESDLQRPESYGTRLTASVEVTFSCDRVLGFGDDLRGACSGDSGGALFVDDGTGERFAGVVSFFDRGRCGPPVYAARPDAYAAWIDSIVTGHADDACASTCPSAGTRACFEDAGERDGSARDAAESALGDALRAAGGCALGGSPTGGAALAVALAMLLARRR